MPRSTRPVVKAAAAAKYLPLPANPLTPLAEEVGRVVALEVASLTLNPSKAAKPAKAAAGVVISANLQDVKALGARITFVVAKVLEQSLNSRTAQGKALRMALIARLANAEIGATDDVGSVAAAPTGADALMTTAEAAAKLEVSRPYVSMLCDSGRLGQVVMTEGGHRRIRASAVEVYLGARTKQNAGALSPLQAGVDAGLYNHPEEHFEYVVREKGAAKNAAAAKAARKPQP